MVVTQLGLPVNGPRENGFVSPGEALFAGRAGRMMGMAEGPEVRPTQAQVGTITDADNVIYIRCRLPAAGMNTGRILCQKQASAFLPRRVITPLRGAGSVCIDSGFPLPLFCWVGTIGATAALPEG